MHSRECPGPRTRGGTCSVAGGRPETVPTSHKSQTAMNVGTEIKKKLQLVVQYV